MMINYSLETQLLLNFIFKIINQNILVLEYYIFYILETN